MILLIKDGKMCFEELKSPANLQVEQSQVYIKQKYMSKKEYQI